MLITFNFNDIERLDMVGYEHSLLTNQLKPLGFESIGNLSVWLKKKTNDQKKNSLCTASEKL